MRSQAAIRFRTRGRVGVNVVMILIVIILVMPLWYVLNNAFKVEREILLRPLLLRPRRRRSTTLSAPSRP